jgi:hypothetical protein
VLFIEDFEFRFDYGDEGNPSSLMVIDSGADRFQHLVSLSEVRSGSTPNQDCWAANPKAGLVSSRLYLDKGTLSTLNLEDNHGTVLPIDFTPSIPNTTWKRREVTQQMIIEISGLKDKVTLEFEPLFGSGTLDSLVLGPEEGCTSRCVVELQLLNANRVAVLNGIFQPNSRRHFEMMWKLVSAANTKSVPYFVKQAQAVWTREAAAAVRTPPDLLCPEVRP